MYKTITMIKKILIILCFFKLCEINSWKGPVKYNFNPLEFFLNSQNPFYKDKKMVEETLSKLLKFAPIVFAEECDTLKDHIANACFGKTFIFMGGDCLEYFDNFSENNVKNMYKLMLQMSILFTHGSGLPTIKIGKIAGHFAKSISENYEKYLNENVLTYRGDIINGYNFLEREPNPKRMIYAYHQSIKILKIINTLGVDTKHNLYTSHECLLLPYEDALTRLDSRANMYYDCSVHFLWLSEMTRDLDSAHVEFLRGINNPIGIKISENINVDELVKLLKILNPNNTPGRILLMTRIGAKNIRNVLPILIKTIQDNKLFVTWCCDPMNGNVIKVQNFDAIKTEVIEYFNIHKTMKSFPGGIDLKLAPNIKESYLEKNHCSKYDTGLNYFQSLELALIISELLKQK
jgi:3-deoxy-7-phosphoheptulonate synthase